ncbi:hypothetical protein BKP56_04030 [Marinilactibacillus sp. 15R]|uniref:hypothetical protein n=1 Tax=Marinilactibacillus sp. 15R TaxID=1911586 RepID=UPI00090A2267|nr:hypothetical protein [Marinilactibacillus sp. 15R]API88517.1 hypothetical protein BKP56_04030 [Marinilactibacillus sp. 15R]
MEIIYVLKTTLEIKWPILLFELILLFGGIMLIVTGTKVRKQSKSTALMSIILGVIIILISLYLLLWAVMFGYNA